MYLAETFQKPPILNSCWHKNIRDIIGTKTMESGKA